MTIEQRKQQLLEQLYAPYKKCMQCPLGGLGRKQVVFGDGNPNAQLMLIGEAPGQSEDEQGKPFVGRSGNLLNKVFATIGIERSDIYITNIVKCRPPNNRKPTELESSICKNLLLVNQIKIIEPRVICTLGAAATQGLVGNDIKITKIRGQKVIFMDTPTIPTYHPAYVLRNQKMLEYLAKDLATAWQMACRISSGG